MGHLPWGFFKKQLAYCFENSSSLYNETLSKGNMSGILLALVSALFWGSGDFSGGFATRKANPFQVLALSAICGFLVLVSAVLITRETIPQGINLIWSLLAGLSGAVGITSLYTALSRGNTAAAAPISAVTGAILPVGYTFVIRGAPAALQIIGIVIAVAGIWLVSASNTANPQKDITGLSLAFLAGVGFGGFFICISQVQNAGVFFPLLLTRVVMLTVALIVLAVRRLPFPAPQKNPVALLAGILDSGGNVFFLLATSLSRLDFAVIISSLYPAVTVLLAALLLKEKVGNWQKAGVVLCLAAIVLISV
jgi:drug/metabolite transporter (DMT)-like permease